MLDHPGTHTIIIKQSKGENNMVAYRYVCLYLGKRRQFAGAGTGAAACAAVKALSLDHGQVVAGAQAGLEEERRAAAAQLALGDDGNAVPQQVRLIHVVGGQDDGAI